MMRVSFSVFFAGMGSLISFGAAGAADLPTKKGAPAAEYVRICPTYGAGFFTIPGSDTCLKIGGTIRYEANLRSNAPTGVANQFAYNLAGQTYSRDTYYYRSREYFNVDARSPTPMGDLRAYFNFRMTQDSLPPGPFGGGKIGLAQPPAPGAKANAGYFQGLPTSQFVVENAYVQWAGITVGVAPSFFDFYRHGYELQSVSVGTSDQPTTLAGYTAKFGGFSASLSAEDPRARQVGDSFADIGKGQNNPKNATTAAFMTYGSVRAPEVVGNLRFEGSWGSAQLSGAVHRVNSAAIFGCSNALAANLNCGNAVGDTFLLPVGWTPPRKWGYALAAGAKINLDALSKGDSATFQVSYEEGAMDYVNAVNYYNGTGSVYSSNQNVGVPTNDAFVLPNGTLGLNKGLGVFAGIQHFWVPNVRSSLFGSYLQIKNPAAAQLLSAGADNAKVWDIGVNTIWSPVKAIDIGAEVVYTDLKQSGLNTLAAVNPQGVTVPGYIPAHSNDVRGRLRLQVSF